MLYLYTMEIIIIHSKGISVTNNAEFETFDRVVDIKALKFEPVKGIKIANLFHLDECEPPDKNEEVEVLTEDKIFLCIFANNSRIEIKKEIWQVKE